MTENPNTRYTPPPSPPGARPPLRRSRNDRVLGGVAGGFARWLGIDPVIVRVILVVLAVFGGSGLLLYLIGWLFIPDEDAASSPAESFIEDTRQRGSTARMVLIIVAAVVGLIILSGIASASAWGNGWGGGWLLLLATGGLVLWLVNRPPSGTAAWIPAASTAPPSADPDGAVTATVPTAASATGPMVAMSSTDPQVETGYAYGGHGGYPGYVAPVPAPTPPPAPRPHSYLGLATLSIAVIVTGILASLSAADVVSIPAVVILSVALGILGIGLLVGTVMGNARWLIAIALPLLLLTALVSCVQSSLTLRSGEGIGDRQWTPTTVAEAAGPFELSIGSAELDLTEVVLPDSPNAVIPVRASVGLGELRIIVPDDVNVRVIASVDLGEIDIEGLPRTNGEGLDVATSLPGGGTAPTIELTADMAVGNLEVSRA